MVGTCAGCSFASKLLTSELDALLGLGAMALHG
jgi:hypothetical protein